MVVVNIITAGLGSPHALQNAGEVWKELKECTVVFVESLAVMETVDMPTLFAYIKEQLQESGG